MILSVAVMFQIALGGLTHWYKSHLYPFQSSSGRDPSNFIHMLLEVLIVAIGWAATWTGASAPLMNLASGQLTRIGNGSGMDQEREILSGKALPGLKF